MSGGGKELKKRNSNPSYGIFLLALFIISVPTVYCTPAGVHQDYLPCLSEYYPLPPPLSTEMILEVRSDKLQRAKTKSSVASCTPSS